MGNDECGAIGGLFGLGNRSTRRKPAPLPFYPLQIAHDLTRARTRAPPWGSSIFLSNLEYIYLYQCRDVAQTVAGFPPQWPEFEHGSGHVGFAEDKVALGQVFSEYFFSCQSLHRLLHAHHHLSSGASAIGQMVADVSSCLSLNPPQNLHFICSEHNCSQLIKVTYTSLHRQL
jgi:hypothetical protein